MPQTDTAIKNAKPRSDKLPDEKGLYLLVTINGGKWCGLSIALMESEKPY